MMLGSASRLKVTLVFGLAALALVLFAYKVIWPALRPAAAPEARAAQPAAASAPARTGGHGAASAPQSLDPTVHLAQLAAAEGVQYKGAGRNIFRSQEEPAPIPKPVAPALTGAAAAPSQPPINLRFFGFASRPGEAKRVFLSSGEDVFLASEGDIVNRRYRVLHIGVNTVEVEDVLGGRRQVLPLTGG